MQEKEFVEKWSVRLSDCKSVDDLPEFLTEMLKDADDYGSIARALGYGAVVTARVMNNSPQGGITGFQAGFVMWTFVREWMYKGNKCGLKIVDYDNMLYPQDSDKFDKVISSSIWDGLQLEALERLKRNPDAHPNVLNHWQSIVDGVVPFGHEVKD